jgi:hypothetical protein
MIRAETTSCLSELFDTDETAWLEQMAALAAAGHAGALDLRNLGAYLLNLARRDKREVLHRLVSLFVHLLKWEYQPDKRARSWEVTIQEQREELQDLLESGTLRNHAHQELATAYQRAIRRAAVETELEERTFPAECPYKLEQALGE